MSIVTILIINYIMEIREAQQFVDEWIRGIGGGYFFQNGLIWLC